MDLVGFASWALLAAMLAGNRSAPGAGAPRPSVSSSTYRGWESLCLDNGLVELQVLPDIGGRVIQFRMGGKEFL